MKKTAKLFSALLILVLVAAISVVGYFVTYGKDDFDDNNDSNPPEWGNIGDNDIDDQDQPEVDDDSDLDTDDDWDVEDKDDEDTDANDNGEDGEADDDDEKDEEEVEPPIPEPENPKPTPPTNPTPTPPTNPFADICGTWKSANGQQLKISYNSNLTVSFDGLSTILWGEGKSFQFTAAQTTYTVSISSSKLTLTWSEGYFDEHGDFVNGTHSRTYTK